jgi:hypothetical protein
MVRFVVLRVWIEFDVWVKGHSCGVCIFSSFPTKEALDIFLLGDSNRYIVNSDFKG